MVLTSRAALAVLLGAVALAWRPTVGTVLLWTLAVALAVAVDLSLAPSPRGLLLERSGASVVRLGESVTTDLVVTNPGRRAVRGLVRDAWQPSAGAEHERHDLRLGSGERTRLSTCGRPDAGTGTPTSSRSA